MAEDLDAGNRMIRRLASRAKEGKLLKPLWQNAMSAIHPGQIGETDQGIGHCLAVECNLMTLISEKKEKLENIHSINPFINSFSSSCSS